jgi:hypothetical protein
MTESGNVSPVVKAKVMAIREIMRDARPHATDIEISGEERAFSWKPPVGFGWSKTNDPKIAIHNSTRHVHVVVALGTGDLYYYK